MSLPPYLQVRPDGLYLAVRVVPRAARAGLAGEAGSELRVRVTASPADGAANEAVVSLLAGVLGQHRRCVQLVRGATSRIKLFRLDGIEPADAAGRLRSHGGG